MIGRAMPERTVSIFAQAFVFLVHLANANHFHRELRVGHVGRDEGLKPGHVEQHDFTKPLMAAPD
jgi:hypothetical protein